MPRASLPADGSVSANVAIFSPLACGTRYWRFCASVPQARSDRQFRPTWTDRITRSDVSTYSSSSLAMPRLT